MSQTLFFIIGFIVALFASWKQAKEKLYHERVIFDALIITVIGAVIGSRTIYILFHFSDFGFNIIKWMVFGLFPGFSLSGGLLGIAVVWWVLSDKKTLVPFPELADVITKSIAVVLPLLFGFIMIEQMEQGHGLAKGIPIPLLNTTLSRHPVTVYKLVAYGMVVLLLAVLHKRKVRLAPGSYSIIFWLLFTLFLFFVDFFRESPIYFSLLALDQWIYLLLLVIICIILSFQIKRKKLYLPKIL